MATSFSRTFGRAAHSATAALLSLAALPALLLVWALASGCDDSDIGKCCTVIAGGDPNLIPMPEKDNNGRYRSIASVNPKFDCEELTCVSYEGSKAYCTKECQFAAACPDGFTCSAVIMSKTSSTAQPMSYCVKTVSTSSAAGSPFMCTQ